MTGAGRVHVLVLVLLLLFAAAVQFVVVGCCSWKSPVHRWTSCCCCRLFDLLLIWWLSLFLSSTLVVVLVVCQGAAWLRTDGDSLSRCVDWFLRFGSTDVKQQQNQAIPLSDW